MSFCPAKPGLKQTTNSKIGLIVTIFLFCTAAVAIFPLVFTYADNLTEQLEKTQSKYESVSQKLANTRSKINDVNNTISKLSGQINVNQAEVDKLQADINSTKAELKKIEESLTDRRGRLAEKTKLRNLVLRNYAKRTILTDLEMFFFFEGLGGFKSASLTSEFNKKVSANALKIMNILSSEIEDFEADKKEAEFLKAELESSQNKLLALINTLAKQKEQAQGIVAGLRDDEEKYVEELERLQQKILSLKSSIDGGTVGDYESPTAKTPDPPFKPAFATFSYGAYTHYKGMSQYGAKGRADAGKNYEDIIKFYYKQSVKEKSNFPSKLKVEGYGEMDFQKYLYGIAEMPSDWNMEALKAQAVAARTFAYRYQKAGKTICTSQSCQVFSKSKSDNPPSRWKEAVDKTKNEIIDGDSHAMYSSTTGGYILDIGWDLAGDKWPGDAYEKKAGSPWFYKAWYTKSYADSNTCGHSHPWLTSEEMADMVNSWVVYKKGSSSEKSHISPTTTSCWGGKPYSLDEMREKAEKYGGGYKKVTGVDVEISNSGYTSQVKLQTDKGSISVDGGEFKTVFNLRAPGYVAIRSRLYDFEKRD